MGRVKGFEILTAPFVVAHLQVGLYLRDLGVPLADGQRAAIHLTNSLTGWDDGPHPDLPIPELAAERDAAERVKREAEVLVVLGNPPYEALAAVPVGEERALRDAYSTTERAPAPVGRATNDLFVRFFRAAERAIVERAPGHGVVCFVTKSVWLDGLGHSGMRERYLDVFSKIWVDNLNGDSRETGKRTPDGAPDPSVFALGGNRSPIQSGVSVTTLVRRPDEAGDGEAEVYYRDLWGKTKLDELRFTSDLTGTDGYSHLAPRARLGYPLVPRRVGDGYLDWPRLTDLFPFSSPGVISARADLVVDIDESRLRERIRKYFDADIPFEALAEVSARAVETTRRFAARDVRQELVARGVEPGAFVRYLYRPFDLRHLYWEPETKLVEEKRPELRPQMFDGNVWLTAAMRERKGYNPPVVTSSLGSFHTVESGASYFPLFVRPSALPSELFDDVGDADRVANLSPSARDYLRSLGASDEPEALFYHTLATLHSPLYREDHSGALRQDWPRVPLPATYEALRESAAVGRRVATILDTERAAVGVTDGQVTPEFAVIAVPERTDGQPFDPSGGDGALTAGWGRLQNGKVFGGKGRLPSRPPSPGERLAMGAEARRLGAGDHTYDVAINDGAVWQNVPPAVWEFTMGGYPVLKKWLSYRERDVLGRDLTADEVRHFQHTARRIAAIITMAGELDAAHRAVLASSVGESVDA